MKSILELYQFKVDPEDLKEARLIMPTSARVAAEVAKTMAQDADGKIRQALIDLGWPPPPEFRNERPK